ncbi:MAG: 2-oxoacid:acceptor oxidoreductase family protein [Lentisphaeria bacterium]|nr:2-oxoacid:acceptor oxidoreductase family protein [Lentisphaeria bacterium]
MSITNIVVSGLGGQGVLKVTDILAEVIFECGFDVKKSEVHGMSQRGGSVSSEIRFGEAVHSPMVPAGEADILAVLDVTQIEVALPVLKAGGILITPDDVPVDKLAHPKALNTMILGALTKHLPQLPADKLLAAVEKAFPEKLRQLNKDMFLLGRGE